MSSRLCMPRFARCAVRRTLIVVHCPVVVSPATSTEVMRRQPHAAFHSQLPDRRLERLRHDGDSRHWLDELHPRRAGTLDQQQAVTSLKGAVHIRHRHVERARNTGHDLIETGTTDRRRESADRVEIADDDARVRQCRAAGSAGSGCNSPGTRSAPGRHPRPSECANKSLSATVSVITVGGMPRWPAAPDARAPAGWNTGTPALLRSVKFVTCQKNAFLYRADRRNPEWPARHHNRRPDCRPAAM